MLRPAAAFSLTALLGAALIASDWQGSVFVFALPAALGISISYREPVHLRRNALAAVLGGALAFGWMLADFGRSGGWSVSSFVTGAVFFAFVAGCLAAGALAVMRQLEEWWSRRRE